jgi:AcrR family transcriptional regulator
MGRWPPDSAARLKACALELFAERGFASVTAAEIASRAGMTERSFFRHYRAKEDVLFEDYSGVRESLAAAIVAAPDGSSVATLMQTVADTLGERFEGERDQLRSYAAVVNAEPALRARALLREQDWSEALEEGFRRRGFSRRRAALLAATTATTFRVVFDEWAKDRARTKLATRFAAALAGLAADIGERR